MGRNDRGRNSTRRNGLGTKRIGDETDGGRNDHKSQLPTDIFVHCFMIGHL